MMKIFVYFCICVIAGLFPPLAVVLLILALLHYKD